jgi:hypothetical protein
LGLRVQDLVFRVLGCGGLEDMVLSFVLRVRAPHQAVLDPRGRLQNASGVADLQEPLSNESGTCKIVKASFWP